MSIRISCVSRIVSFVLVALFFAVSPGIGYAADACQKIVGKWNWFIGGHVILSDDHKSKYVPGMVGMPPGEGTWECHPGTDTITITWSNGFIDNMTVSEDGSRVQGKSNTGVTITGWRSGPDTRKQLVKNVCDKVPDTLGAGACGLVSPRDVCQTMKEAYQPGRRITGNQGDSCRFKPEDPLGDIIEISLAPVQGFGYDHRAVFFRHRKNLPRYFSMARIGESAHATLDLVNRKMYLYVLSSATMFNLEFTGMRSPQRQWTKDDKLDQGRAIATKAEERLKTLPGYGRGGTASGGDAGGTASSGAASGGDSLPPVLNNKDYGSLLDNLRKGNSGGGWIPGGNRPPQ